jgi:raffinose/stachyose/melibiose transport system permease protein
MTAQLTRPPAEAGSKGTRPASPRSADLKRRRRTESLVAYIFIAPAVLTFVVFMAVPMLLTAALSFFDWSGISLGSLKFAGFDNYVKLSQDPVFWQSLGNNLIFILLGMGISVALGLFVAVLLERNLPGSSFFRGVFFLPTVLSTVVVGIVFTFLISPVFGVIRPIFALVGIDFNVALLGDPKTALYTIIFVEIWRAFGFAMFLFVAGLKSLDETLVEAAKLDGASGSQVFWYVTFPQLRPVTLLVATLVGIQMLKLFDLVFVMTGGGPQNATEVLTTFLYKQGFNFNEVGYGSAIAVVLLIITFILTLIRFKFLPDSTDKTAEVER